MFRWMSLCALLLSAPAVLLAQDAVAVDPEHHKVEFENEQIRVVRMIYPPGYKTPMHGHLPGVSITLSGTKVHTWNQSGEESDGETTAGSVSWSDGTSVHANEVVGSERLELVRIEIKKKGTVSLPLPEHDTVKLDPEHHKVEVENDQVRAIRVTYPAGYETPLHDHLPGISVTLKDRTWEAAFASGRKAGGETVKAGTVSGLGAADEPHRTKNVGSSTGESIRIELKTKL